MANPYGPIYSATTLEIKKPDPIRVKVNNAEKAVTLNIFFIYYNH